MYHNSEQHRCKKSVIIAKTLERNKMMQTDLSHAQQLDAQDPLASFRDRFLIPDPSLIYVDGNSLGRMPKATKTLLEDVQHTWSERLIRSWGEKYIHIAQQVGAKIAQIVGAKENEVVIAESTSVNLFKLAVAALRSQPPTRTKIITDDLNFPSDIYILDGVCKLLGNDYEIVVIKSEDGIHAPAQQIMDALGDDTALVTLSHTVFKSAYTYDMAAITDAAHDAGALVLWDLSHSVGSVPVALNAANADLAIGCTYKYLNGGIGSNAFLYVREDLQDKLENPIQGWFGQANMFAFDYAYAPKANIDRFLTGTPNVLSIAPIEIGVNLLIEAGMEQIRAKSLAQTEYLIALYDELLAPLGYQLNSPRDGERRGSHISLGHAKGWQITQCLIERMNIIPDFRAPDNIRIGITPLYTSFVEIHTLVMRLKEIVEEGLYGEFSAEIDPVIT